MRFALQTAILAPVLLVQGRRVRRATPKLPEAEGPRAGIDGSGPALHLLLLGDSAAAGVGVAHQREALAGQLVARLAQRHTVHWRIEARTGDTIAEVIARVQSLAAGRFDAVVVSVGVNDATGRTGAGVWRQRLHALIDAIDTRFGAPAVFVCAIPQMQAFPALPAPLAGWLGQAAARLNRITQAELAGHPRAHYTPFGFDPNPQWMADDGFHPSAAGYRRWAEALAGAIEARGSSAGSA